MYNTREYYLFFCFMFSYLVIRYTSVNVSDFVDLTDARGYTCQTNNTIFEEDEIYTVLKCARKCEKYSNCVGFLYNTHTFRCEGCNDTFNVSYLESGSEKTLAYRLADCPDADGRLPVNNGFRIKIYNDYKPYENASAICTSVPGGRLVRIDEPWKREYVSHFLMSCPVYSVKINYWVEGTQQSATDVWSFANGNALPMEENVYWAPGKPESPSYDAIFCVKLLQTDNQYLWDNGFCNSKFNFICEY